MSATATPRELAELALRRLNRAATDLGLTLPGRRPLFSLDEFSFNVAEEDDADLPVGPVEVFDIVLAAVDIEDYSWLATQLEKLAERVPTAHTHPVHPDQGVLPGF